MKTPALFFLAIFALTGIISTLVFCYVDLGLVSGRVTVFLGTLLGVIGVLDRVMMLPDSRIIPSYPTTTKWPLP